MIDLKNIVALAESILEWVESVKNEEGSQKKLAYQLSHRAEAFYNIGLPEQFDNNLNISAMRTSILSARSCIHDLSREGEIRAVLLFGTIVGGLKEIIALSEGPFEVVRFEDNPPADIYGSPDISKVVVFKDADTINDKDALAVIARTEQPYNYAMFSTKPTEGYGISGSPVIGLYANKDPVASDFADFDGDVIKAYHLTMSCTIKRGPGKGRTRVVSRFVSVFN